MTIGGQALRYGVVGLLNTVIGLSVIWGLMRAGLAPVPANMLGYAAGLTISFFLNRTWTFRAPIAPGQIGRYLVAFVLSYGLNLLILTCALYLWRGDGYLAQLVAVGAYTVAFFLLCRTFVFAGGRSQ